MTVADPNAALNDIRTLSATFAGGIPRVAWVMDGPNTFSYAECTANCGSLAPTFASAIVYGPPARRVEAGTLAASATAGVVAAIVSSRTFAVTLVDGGSSTATAYDLYYGACAANCLTPASWTWTLVHSGVGNDVPQIVTTSTITGIAYDDNGDVQYAECAGNCSAAGSWSNGQVDSSALSGRPGLALAPPVRAIVGTSGDYFRCISASCTSGSGWSAPYTGISYDDGAFLVFLSNGLPRVFGHQNSNLLMSRCATLPCTSSADWADVVIATGAYPGFEQIDVVLDPQDRALIAYRTAGTNINMLREQVDAGWLTSPLPACGTQAIGALPVPLLAPDGGLSVFYQATTFGEVRYYVQP